MVPDREPVKAPGVRFSEVPKRFGSISGATISFISFRNTGFLAIKPRNPLGFSFIKNMLKVHLFKTSGLKFDNWFRATGPRMNPWIRPRRTSSQQLDPASHGATRWRTKWDAKTCRWKKIKPAAEFIYALFPQWERNCHGFSALLIAFHGEKPWNEINSEGAWERKYESKIANWTQFCFQNRLRFSCQNCTRHVSEML